MTASTIVHDALVYSSEDAYLSTVVPFLEEGLAAGEGAVVATHARNRALLSDALGPRAGEVVMVDSGDVYRSPQDAVAAYHEVIGGFLSAGRPSVRAIGEVAYPADPDEQRAWMVYEPIAHTVFAESPLHVICPYDTRLLPPFLLEHAARTHQHLCGDIDAPDGAGFRDPEEVLRSLGETFPFPTTGRPDAEIDLADRDLARARRVFADLVARHLSADRAEEAALAITELLTNGMRYGTGSVAAAVWLLPDVLVCEVANDGPPIEDPAAGYRPPEPTAGGGMGLWIVRRLADAMSVARTERGPVVRFAMSA